MEAESFAACRANFCQGESSPELETIFQGRGVPFSLSITPRSASTRSATSSAAVRARGVDTEESVHDTAFRELHADVRYAARSQSPPRFEDLGCAAGFQETRDVRKRVPRRPHYGRLAVRVLR